MNLSIHDRDFVFEKKEVFGVFVVELHLYFVHHLVIQMIKYLLFLFIMSYRIF